MIKRIITVTAFLVLAAMSGCTGVKEQTGSWTINHEYTAVFRADDAVQPSLIESENASLKPVTVLASQVVSGVNYAVLCFDEASGTWNTAVLYIDAAGKSSLTSVKEITIPDVAVSDSGLPEGLAGGWTVNDAVSNEITLPKDVFAAYQNAAEAYDDLVLYPIALLASQPVSGTNYLVLAKGMGNGGMQLYVTNLYVHADNTAELNEVKNFDLLHYVKQ